MKKIAFIGSGTMGTALATAACKGIDPSEVVITDVVTEKGQKLADELGCNFVETNGEAIKAAHYVAVSYTHLLCFRCMERYMER